MTDTEIDIAVAEELGWRLAARVDPSMKLSADLCWIRPNGNEWQEERRPNYSQDRNATDEMETSLWESHDIFLPAKYIIILREECDKVSAYAETANAKTRCIAFLKLKGKYKQ